MFRLQKKLVWWLMTVWVIVSAVDVSGFKVWSCSVAMVYKKSHDIKILSLRLKLRYNETWHWGQCSTALGKKAPVVFFFTTKGLLVSHNKMHLECVNSSLNTLFLLIINDVHIFENCVLWCLLKTLLKSCWDEAVFMRM